MVPTISVATAPVATPPFGGHPVQVACWLWRDGLEAESRESRLRQVGGRILSADHDKGRRPSSEVLARYGRKGGTARKTKSGGLWRRLSEGVSAKADVEAATDSPLVLPLSEDPSPAPGPGDEPAPVLFTEPTRPIPPSPEDGIDDEPPPQAQQATSAQTTLERRNPTDRDPAASPNEAVALELVLPNGRSIVLVGRAPAAQANGLLRVQVDPAPTNPATLVTALHRMISTQTAEQESTPLIPGATERSPLPPGAAHLQQEPSDTAGTLPDEQASAAQRDFQTMPETAKLRPDSDVLIPTTQPPPLTWGRGHGRRHPSGTTREPHSEAQQEHQSPRVRRGGAAAARRSDPFATGDHLGPDPFENNTPDRFPGGSRRTPPLRGHRTAQNTPASNRPPSSPDDSSDDTEQ